MLVTCPFTKKCFLWSTEKNKENTKAKNNNSFKQGKCDSVTEKTIKGLRKQKLRASFNVCVGLTMFFLQNNLFQFKNGHKELQKQIITYF